MSLWLGCTQPKGSGLGDNTHRRFLPRIAQSVPCVDPSLSPLGKVWCLGSRWKLNLGQKSWRAGGAGQLKIFLEVGGEPCFGGLHIS